MTSEKERSGTLEACVSKGQSLADLVEYSEDSIVSKTILDKSAGTITLFAFDKGQKLSEHTAPFDAVVSIVDGKADVKIDGHSHVLEAGENIIMPANIPHSLHALEKFKMVLTMIKSK